MSKWTDVDVLKARIDQEVKEDKVLSGWAFFFKVYLDEASSIDIVRCKECRYKDMDICPMYRLVVTGVRKADDFCSYGERKEQ